MQMMTAEAFKNSFPAHGSIDDQIRHMLRAATRAPSTHNSQPWRFSIQDNTLTVLRDTRVVLPNSDAKTRYAHISIGFLLHHIIVLSEWLGMHPSASLSPKDEVIAKIHFSQSKAIPVGPPPLVSALFERRNRRGIFTATPIPAHVIEEATHSPDSFLPHCAVRTVSDRSAKTRLADLTAEVMHRVYAIPAFRREMSLWITPSGSGRADGIPGYSLNQPMVISWILPMLIRLVNIGKIPAKVTHAAIASAAVLFGFGADESPVGWLSVGGAASHASLTLVANGFDYSVFVASIEYPDTRLAAGREFALEEPLQFFFATGKLEGSVDWMTPRLPLGDKLA